MMELNFKINISQPEMEDPELSQINYELVRNSKFKVNK